MSRLLLITVILSLSITFTTPVPLLANSEDKLGCNMIEVFACMGEIEGMIAHNKVTQKPVFTAAWPHCKDLTTPAEIQACITALLGSSDCVACLCDWLEEQGLAKC